MGSQSSWAAVMERASCTSEIVVAGRVQHIALTDKAPHREMVVWNMHNYAVSQAEARKVRRRAHRMFMAGRHRRRQCT